MLRLNLEAKPRAGAPDRPALDLFNLAGRTIMTTHSRLHLTGGVGAMGSTTAQTVLECGGDVICIDYHEKPDGSVWSTIKKAAKRYEGQAWYYSVDVTDTFAVGHVLEVAVSKTRYPLRGVVACAGISGESLAVDYPMDAFRRILDINLSGAFICVQAAAREIVKAGHSASIVFIASISAHNYNKGVNTVAYNCSKSGVVQLARSLAAEWGASPKYPLIRVNTLSPGYIRTPLTEGALARPNLESEWSNDNMMGRLSYIDEYRGPILYLLSDASSFMTAADLVVDGGHTGW